MYAQEQATYLYVCVCIYMVTQIFTLKADGITEELNMRDF